MSKRKTLAIIYSILKLYGTLRSKSYNRVLQITKEFSVTHIKHYYIKNVFVPTSIKKNVYYSC